MRWLVQKLQHETCAVTMTAQSAHVHSDGAVHQTLEGLLRMQAALTAMDKKCKNALARSERLCEASIDGVRRGAAASIAAEATRLEGLLTGCTTRSADMAFLDSSGQQQDAAPAHHEVHLAAQPSHFLQTH